MLRREVFEYDYEAEPGAPGTPVGAGLIVLARGSGVPETHVRRRRPSVMSSDPPTRQQATEGSEHGVVQRRHYMTRAPLALVLFGVVGLAVCILWHLSLPDTAQSGPGLSEHDKSEIARLCRSHALRYCVDNLRRAEFGAFSLGIRNLFRQKIDRFIDNRDGTYRAYVVVYDKQAPDGFNPWSRHQLTKTNGHWTILRSY